MRHVASHLLGQMRQTRVFWTGVCIASVFLFVTFSQKSAAQQSTTTLTDSRSTLQIKTVDEVPTSTVKKDGRTSKNTPRRLIRKPQSASSASLQPIPRETSRSTSTTVAPTLPQPDMTPTQSKDATGSGRTNVVIVPSTSTSSAMSAATTASFATVGTTTTTAPSVSSGTTALTGATTASASTKGSTRPKGRAIGHLKDEMPGLDRLMTPPQSSPSPSPAPPSPPPVPPAIGASPTSLSFTATQGGANPAAQTLTISNTGGGTLSWSASDSAPWLTLSAASGTGNGTVSLTVATGTLATGSYSGLVTLTATGATPITVPVTFTVAAAPVPPAIGVSPVSLSFTAQQAGGNPAPQTLNISNTGGGTLSWSASDSAPWLTLSGASGTGNGTVCLTVATGTLAAGSYNGTVTLSATGATPVSVPVAFTVTAVVSTVTPSISLSPTSLTFAATQGTANPAAKTLNITNPGTGTLTWSIADNANWLTVTPASGATTTGTSPVTASVNTAGLVAGSFTATITVTGTGATNTPRTIPVTLTLNAPSTSSATLAWDPNTEPDLVGYKVYIATAPGAYPPAPIATLPKTALGHVATGLQVGTTYFFTITAYDKAGNESVKSVEVSKSIF